MAELQRHPPGYWLSQQARSPTHELQWPWGDRMISGIVRFRVARAYAALAAGDARPAVKAFAKDGRFLFPGDHVIAADCLGTTAITAWFERFARLHPHFELLDVIVGGPPWNMRCMIRFADQIGDDYANEGVQYVRLRG